MATEFRVPENITVHLGRPDQNAPNVTVPFSEYIKNVASSEVYPTWPESAIRANIYAQISIALNRLFTEYYRSRGYNFDITNSTQYDQSFVYGREYFSNISEIVDNIFNNFIVRQGNVEPLFAAYCDGVEVQCSGLSQWGTVDLANRGYTPYEILQYYFGDNINIVSAPVGGEVSSYPGIPLRLGSVGEEVRVIQEELNRIRRNYPLIPKIAAVNGIFGQDTENAVKVFQGIFSLPQDGIVGKGTWYQIIRVFFAVKNVAELLSEGISVSDARRQFSTSLQRGDSGDEVSVIQLYLRILAYFIPSIPFTAMDGVFGQGTENAVKAFQTYVGLEPDGIVGRSTWNSIINEYYKIESSLQGRFETALTLPPPGHVLTIGSTGSTVRRIQEYLNVISRSDPSVPSVTVDGVFGEGTARAVRAIQRQFGLDPSGEIGILTWNAIISRYNDLRGE